MSSHLLQLSVFLIPGMPGSIWASCLLPQCSQAWVITSCVALCQKPWKSLGTAHVNWIVCLGCWPIGAPFPTTVFGRSARSWNHAEMGWACYAHWESSWSPYPPNVPWGLCLLIIQVVTFQYCAGLNVNGSKNWWRRLPYMPRKPQLCTTTGRGAEGRVHETGLVYTVCIA